MEKDAAGCPSLPIGIRTHEPRHKTYLTSRLPYFTPGLRGLEAGNRHRLPEQPDGRCRA